MAGFGSAAYAGNLPSGGVVVGGSATISQPTATQLQITSTTTRSAISWQDFSIGSGYGVNVTQPNAGSTQLEQVRGTNVSQIFGSLTSNGRIVIANPNGIWFGPNAQVDVAGLTASTAHATATDIQNFQNGGNLALSQAGNANAAIVNQGNITISNAGLAAFVAPGVRNDGIIQAKLGTVQLSSGTTATLDFYGDGLVSIAVSGQTLSQAIDPSTGKALGAAVTNTGTLNADGGTVLVTANVASNVVDDAINTSGVIQARSVSTQNGQIVLDGGSNGAVQVAGNLDASGTGAGQTGGSVQVLGNQVALNAGASVNVAGDAGGGTALIGGNFHGAGPERNAQATHVDANASIDADALTTGNGGQVAVWSDQATTFNGTITARGGSQSGNGGQVETSGHQLSVGDTASVNTAAPVGQAGNWLLDPADITITAGSVCTNIDASCTGVTWQPTSGSATSTIGATTVSNALNSGDVYITTTNAGSSGGGVGDISVQSAISRTAAGTATLTLDAANNISFSAGANVSATTGALNLTLNAGGAINTLQGASLNGGTLTLNAAGNVTQSTAVISGTGTSVVKNGAGTFTLSLANTYTGTTTVNAGTLTLSGNNRLAASSSLVVNGGTFNLATRTNALAAVQLLSGSITGTTGVLTSTAAFDMQSGTVSAILGGTAGLNKTTAGTVTLSGVNTYTGTTTVSTGMLTMGASNVFANTSSVVVNGGALDINARTDTVAAVQLALGSIAGTTGVLTSTAAFDMQSGTVSAILGGTAGMNKTTAGTVTLSGANTYSGATTISAGVLKLGASNVLPSTAVMVGDGGTLDLNGATDAIGALTVSSGTTGGTVTNSAGTAATLTLGGNVTSTGGATNALISAGTGGLTLGLGATRTFSVTNAADGLAVSAVIDGTGFGITKTNTGTLTLSGTNTYTGVTTINAGVLSVATIGNGGSASNIGASTSAAANLVLGGGTLQYTGATASTNRSFILTGGTTSTIDVTANNLTISGASTNTNGALTKIGAGTLTLAGANLYTGTTAVSAGTLAAGVNNALSSGPVNVSGGTWDIDGFTDTVGAVTLTSGTISGTSGVLTGTSYTVQSGTISAILAGTGGLTKTTTGTVTLSGTNTYTGVTTINAGVLSVATIGNGGSASNIGASTSAAANLVLGGGTLQYTGATASTNRSFILTGGTTSTIDVTANNLTISGASTNTNGALTKIGSGMLTLSGNNGFTGGLTIKAGTVLGTTSANAFGSGGTITLGDSGGSADATLLVGTSGLTIARPIALGGSTGILTIGNNGAGISTIFSGGITGSNNLTIDSGSASGTVTENGAIGIGAGSTLTLNGGGTFTLTNAGNDVASLGGSIGTVSFRDDTGFDIAGLTASGSVTLSTTGTVTETGGAITAASGTLTLNGVNGTYSLGAQSNDVASLAGSTGTINFRDDNGFAIAAGGLSASNGITLSTTGIVSQGGAITATAGTGTLTLNGAGGDYVLDNTANSVGHLAADTGRITFSDNGGFDVATLTATSRITLNSTGTVTESGAITIPNLVLTVTGGTFTLTGSNSVGMVAAQVGSLNLTDVSHLTVGTVGSVTGITSTGNVTLTETAASGGIDFGNSVSVGGTLTASTIGGNITLNAGVTLRADGTGDAIVLKPGTNAVAGTITGGDFVNDSGASALSTPSGKWVVYTGHDNTGGTTVGGLTGYTMRYNTDTTNFTPLAGINFILYRVAPTLTVTPGAASVTYDGTTLTNATYSQNTANYSVGGFINGDTIASSGLSLSGSMAFNGSTGTTVRNAATYGLTQGTLAFANNLNYTVAFDNPAPNAYVINQRPITVTAASNTKVYNADTDALAVPTITSGSLGSGDVANFTESYGTKNVGTSLTLTPAGTVTDGNSGNNYSVTFVNNTTGVITVAPLTITAAANTKTYDGGVTAAATPTVSGLQGSDSVTGLAETYDNKNAGSGKTLSVSSGYTVNDGNDGNNYTVSAVANATGVIGQREVTLSGSRTYDGTTGADASILAITNNVDGAALTLSGAGTLVSKDVGTQLFHDAGSLTLGGSAASNYSLAGVTTNGSAVTISSLGIIVELAGTRVYDGTTDAPAAILTIANKQSGDDLTLSGTGTLVSKNVGSELFADAGTLALGGTSAPNYTLTGIDANGSAVNITARPITVTAATNTKVYNASTNAAAVPTVTSGSIASGDTANFTESYSTKNVGSGLTLTPTGTVTDGNSGNNYSVTFADNTTGVITVAPLTITAAANTKTYDGGVTAAATPTVSGLQGSDSVTGLSETYDNKNAGSSKLLSVAAGYTVNDGNDGNNYTVSTVTNNTGVINKAALTITAAANTKTYDAGITAAATPTVSGLVGSDTATGVAETYDNWNAGTGKTLSVSAYTINDGVGGANYAVSTFTNNTGVINAAPLTITAATNTKVYDGGITAAAVPTVSGLQGGDTVTGLAEQYNTKHARAGKTLMVTSYTINDGAGGANYIVSTLDNTTGVITPAPLTVTAQANTKTYDGGVTAAALPLITAGTLKGTDTATLSETYDNKNAGSGKTLTPLATINDGNAGANYNVTYANNTAGVISQKALTVTAQANTKTYDGGVTAATMPLITVGALQGTDTAVLSETYDNKNTGGGKTLTPLVVINDGVGGANYTVTYANNTAGEIDKAPLSITADNKSKIVGTVNPILTASYTGLVGGDTSSVVTGLSLATTATTTSPVGTYAITASGGTATNYVISYVDGVLTITAPSGSVVQVTRQAFYPGEPMPYAFGPTPTVNLGMEVGGVVAEGEVAGVGPFPGEGYYLEDAIRFANDFLSGGEDLHSEP